MIDQLPTPSEFDRLLDMWQTTQVSNAYRTLYNAFADERMEHDLLKELLSRPEIDEFEQGVILEAAHQRQRWGDAHDRSKSAENWYWLVGYLAGKALRSAIEGDQTKARHHTISSAAALFHWWKAIKDQAHGVEQDTDLASLTEATP